MRKDSRCEGWGGPSPFSNEFQALTFHKIDWWKSGVLRRGLYLSPRIFRRQMRAWHEAGFATATTPETGGPSCHRKFLITFDDGFSNVLDHGLPILREFHFRSINFLVSGRLGQTNTWDALDGERAEPLMDDAQVRDWLADGQEIGAHSVTHAHLTRLSPDAAREEITASKKALEDRFSRAVTDFAYPFGEFDQTVRELVIEAGFERAWTTEPADITADADSFALPRHTVAVSLRRPLNLLRSLRLFAR